MKSIFPALYEISMNIIHLNPLYLKSMSIVWIFKLISWRKFLCKNPKDIPTINLKKCVYVRISNRLTVVFLPFCSRRAVLAKPQGVRSWIKCPQRNGCRKQTQEEHVSWFSVDRQPTMALNWTWWLYSFLLSISCSYLWRLPIPADVVVDLTWFFLIQYNPLFHNL